MAQKSKANGQTGGQHKNAELFLAALADVGNVCRACEVSGVGRSTVYEWRADPEFEAQFKLAMEEATERLELEARRRAYKGTEKPVYQGGKLVGHVREYSDTLLIFLLKGANPDKYRERTSITVEDPVKALAKLLNVKPEDIPC